MDCESCGATFKTIFCPNCKKAVVSRLKSVRLQGFHGPASLSPTVEKFWETGDPDVL
jgi:predicted amidophosphoribosyltransferase